MTSSPPISLRPITAKTVRQILRLTVTAEQKNWVAPNAFSISEAYFEPKAWLRAVYAADEPVGFMMTYEDHEKPVYYLWRFMIDHHHQSKGYGRRALELLTERLATLEAAELELSVVPDNLAAIKLYEAVGFVDTGRVEDEEKVFKLTFA